MKQIINFNLNFFTKSKDQYYNINAKRSFKYNQDLSQKNHQTISTFHHYGHLYEPDIGNFLVRIIKPGDVCVDVGANIGMHTLLMASLNASNDKEEKAKIISFEPNEKCYNELKKNIKLNKYKTVEVRQKLLGEKPGVESFYHASDKDSGTSYALKEIDDQSLNWEKVKTSTLDKELKHEKSIKVLKMDVEGFEGNVLRGSKNLLEKDLIRYWIIEYTQHCLARNNDSLDTLRTLMEKHNLEMFILDPSGGLPKFIPNKVALKTFTIPNLLFTKTKYLNEDWVMEDLESHVNPKSLWPNINVR
jgi:FkbM family methyltransferase